MQNQVDKNYQSLDYVPPKKSMKLVEMWFEFVCNNARAFVLANLIVLLICGSFLPRLYKDTTTDAYIEETNPALIYRDKVKAEFGLDDPYIVAMEPPEGETIYTPATMAALASLTERLQHVPNLDPDRISSLSTEKIISGANGEITVLEPLDELPATNEEASAINARVDGFPLFPGKIAAKDGNLALVIVEVLDPEIIYETYLEVTKAVAEFDETYPGKLYVAGEAAASGFLSEYVSQDARRLYPFCALVIIIVLYAAFRQGIGIGLPLIIAIATAATVLGIRALFGVPFFSTSNALLVVLVGISIADSIHIISEYRDRIQSGEYSDVQSAIVDSMTIMFLPVTLTSVTTIAGFVGIWLGSTMPPMQMFGLFAASGVVAAWAYSVVFLPASMLLLHRKRPFAKLFGGKSESGDPIERWLERIGRLTILRPRMVFALASVSVIVFLGLATQVVVDYNRITNFGENEPVRVADGLINRSMDGSYRLLVVVEAADEEGLYEPDVLNKIDKLQEFALTLPGVNGVISIVDVIKQINKAVADGDEAAAIIPDDPDMVAQLILLYESSGDPMDLEDEINGDRNKAVVKIYTTAGSYLAGKPIIESMNTYLDETFNDDTITGSLSGRVFLNHHWLKGIDDGHFTSVAIALVLVFLMAIISFRSVIGGLLCLAPVLFAVVSVYAIMVLSGINLGVVTSMFAAISIGLGVDFAIHTIDRVRVLVRVNGNIDAETITPLYPTTGRALFFNMVAIALGFGVLGISNSPAIVEFAVLLVTSVIINSIASVNLLPPVLLVLKPAFLLKPKQRLRLRRSKLAGAKVSGIFMLFVAAIAVYSVFTGSPVKAEEISAAQIVKNVTARPEANYVSRSLDLTMTKRSGKEKKRNALSKRVRTESERRSLFVFEKPSNIKGTAFLTFNYHEVGKSDDQWLYLPAMRKSRRISGASRGQYFMGTDLTYEDLKNESKFDETDFNFTLEGQSEQDGRIVYEIKGIPVSPKIAKELGYSEMVALVDGSNWVFRQQRIKDIAGNDLKTIYFEDVHQIDGIWAIGRIRAENHKSGHNTVLQFSDIDFSTEFDQSDLSQNSLKRAGK